jgi:integrase
MPGSKRQLGPGRWELRVYLGRDPITGRQRTRSKTFHGGARAADKALTEFAAANGTNTGTRHTFRALVAKWLSYKREDWSPTTYATYTGYLNKHVLPVLGDLPVEKITAELLDELYRHLRDQGLARSTVTQIHAIISSALTRGKKWGWVALNVAQDASPPRPQKDTDPGLPAPEIVRQLAIVAAERDPDLATMIGVLLKLGCRRGELCGLQWRDVGDGQVRIARAVVQVAGSGPTVQNTKTHSGRVLSIDDATVSALEAHRARMVERAEWAGLKLSDRSFVFSRDPAGREPMRPGTISQAWSRLCRREGVEGVRLHDLRHMNATYLLLGGVQLATVSQRLGHRKQSTTSDVYSHALQASDRHAATVAGELL